MNENRIVMLLMVVLLVFALWYTARLRERDEMKSGVVEDFWQMELLHVAQ